MQHLSLYRAHTVFIALLWCWSVVSTGIAGEPGAQATAFCHPNGWPQEESDLAPDPSIIYGRLTNGVRYVLKTNPEPRNRVALYLNVQAGSLHETEEQRGVAHFLEHMLFNGTTHYPPGTLVNYFQSLGMGFGGDTNAHTGFDETVYNLMLPSSDSAALEEGFKVLADYARGALLLEKEVARERGVILSEKRSRDSASARVSKQQLAFDFAGTLVPHRDPIGVEEVLHAADSKLLRTYYDRWYRPENMVVVVVGDIRPEEAARALEKSFSGLLAIGEPGICPQLGEVRDSDLEILYLPEPELGYTGVALTTVYNAAPQPDTQAWEVEQLTQQLAQALLGNRLEKLEQKTGSPLAQPKAQTGVFLHRLGYATLTARTEAGKWQEGVRLLQTTLAQALAHGFTEGELARGKREIQAVLEKAAETAPSRDSRQVAEDIIRKLNSQEVILSPGQELALYQPLLEKLTLAEVNAALRQLWSRTGRRVEVVGAMDPALAPETAEAQLRAAFLITQAQEPLPWKEEQPAVFPYLPLPVAAGEMVAQVHHAEIGVESFVFEGGVHLHCKATDFQTNQVMLSIQFGTGRMGAPQEGLAPLAEPVLHESGLGGLTREQLEEVLAGTNASLEFKLGPESFSLMGKGLSKELELLVQLAYHRLHDPAFRPEGFHRARETVRRMYDQLASSVEGGQQMRGERFLAPGNREYGMATWEEVEPVGLEQIRGWLAPALAHSPLEINIVGDIKTQEAVRLVARYFGKETRREKQGSPATAGGFPAGKSQRFAVPSSIDKAMLTVAWQTSDFWDIDRTRRLNLLAAVLDDRLRVKIREELGATYSPHVASHPSRAHAGFGLMEARLVVAPEQAEPLAKVIREVAAELGKNGVSPDELHRALEPVLTSIKDAKRSNRYWLEAVLNHSVRHPQQLQWPLTIGEGFAAIKAEELTALAARYLQPEQAAVVIVAPEEAKK